MGDAQRQVAPGRFRVELRELQADAFRRRARTDPGGVERLHEGEDLLDVLLAHRQVGAQAARDVGDRFGEVAVVVQRVNDRLADPHLARIELAHLELPDQVLVQVAFAFVAELEGAVVVVLRAAVARGRRGFRPRVLHLDDDLVRFLALAVIVVAAAFALALAFRRRLVEGTQVELLVLLGLEHDVRLEGFLNLGLELEHGQLQQPDGLLELRRHRQLLTEL